VIIFDINEHQGGAYFSRETRGGGTWEEFAPTPLPPTDAARLVDELARGMHQAHQAGTVRRGIQPGDVRFTLERGLQITELGGAEMPRGRAENTRALVLATACYDAPEQVGGCGMAAAGPPADVYTLGAALYQLLTGKAPLTGSTPQASLRQVLWDEPLAPRRVQPGVPPDLETICLRCLEKDPGRRYPNALALSEDLCRFLSGEPVAAQHVGNMEQARRWWRRRPVVAVILFLVGALGGTAWQLRHAETSRKDLAQAIRSHQILEHLERILYDLSRAEAAQRGYLLTGKKEFLQHYEAALAGVRQTAMALPRVGDGPDRSEKLTALDPMIAEALSRLGHVVVLRHEEDPDAQGQVDVIDRVESITGRIRSVINDLQQEERRRLDTP
jgi:CHASE3 domain sensor protein